jgi:exonuclease VII small subunit
LSSLEQLRHALDQVREHLHDAYSYASSAQRLLAQARAVLDEVNRNHPEPLTPPEMRHADAEIDRALVLVASTADKVEEFAARI